MNTPSDAAKKICLPQKKSNRIDARDAIGVQMFRIELLKRGMTSRELAGQIGMKPESFFQAAARGLRNRKLRARIESALNVEIWATKADFKRRQQARAVIGADPEVLSRPQLKEWAAKLGMNPAREMAHADLVRLVTAGAVKGK
jgi:hypothetical protein